MIRPAFGGVNWQWCRNLQACSNIRSYPANVVYL
jgi:hypothetical protein